MSMKRYSYIGLWLCILALVCPQVSFAVDEQLSVGLSEVAVKIHDKVEIGRMRKDIARLSNLSTRVTGYDEAASGSKYIFDQFVEIGLQNVESREFPVSVPIDHDDGKVEILSEDLQNFAFVAQPSSYLAPSQRCVSFGS